MMLRRFTELVVARAALSSLARSHRPGRRLTEYAATPPGQRWPQRVAALIQLIDQRNEVEFCSWLHGLRKKTRRTQAPQDFNAQKTDRELMTPDLRRSGSAELDEPPAR